MDNLKTYLDGVKRKPILTEQQCQDYFKQIGVHRNALIEGNLRLVVKAAFEIHEGWKNVDVMDLIQEGSIGLIQAVDRYKADKGYKFSTFALYRIKGAIIDYIKDNTSQVRTGTTKAQREIFYNFGLIKDELEQQGADLNRIAQKFEVKQQDILDMSPSFVNINDECIQDELINYETPEDVYIKNETLLNLKRKIIEFRDTLNKNEQFIWDCRIMEKQLTLDECRKPLKFKHTENVRRLEKSVLDKAKDYFQSLDYNDIMGAIS